MAFWKMFTVMNLLVTAAVSARASTITGSELRTRMVNAIIKAKSITNIEAEAEIVSPLTSPYQTMGVGIAFIGQVLNETGVLGTNGIINYYPYEVVYKFKEASASVWAANCTLSIYSSQQNPDRFLVHSHTCNPANPVSDLVPGAKEILGDYQAIVIVSADGNPVFVKPLEKNVTGAGLAALLDQVW